MDYINKILEIINNNYFTSILIGGIIIYLFYVLCYGLIFKKTGIASWKSLVPFYNLYLYLSICNVSFIWYFLQVIFLLVSLIYTFFLLPALIITLILHVYLMTKLAKVFGKGFIFTIGLIIVHPLFILILSFDKSKYLGLAKEKDEMTTFVSNQTNTYNKSEDITNYANTINCPNCGVQLSASTKNCIRCGYKISE